MLFGLLFQFSPQGTECRPADNECDLPEYCTGTSPVVRIAVIATLFTINQSLH